MQHSNITFIGGGKMTRALVAGLVHSGFPASHITVTNRTEDKLEYFKSAFGVNVTTDNIAGAKDADVVVLGLRPRRLPDVCKELREVIAQSNPLVISVAAGIKTQTLKSWLHDGVRLVRAMPNTPAMVAAGATGLYADDSVDQELRDFAESIFESVGVTLWFADEAQFPIVTALSGSGPGYFFYIMQSMQQAAVDMGLSDADARLLTVQTALGSARIALESDSELGELHESMKLPKGTTVEGLRVLEQADIEKLFSDAIQAAAQRAREIADEVQ